MHWFEIEAKGHGITYLDRPLRGEPKVYLPGHYRLVNMLGKPFQAQWENIRKWFGPRCQMPDELDGGRWWADPMELIKRWS